jgi:drug/metabolite transporter (DMT)-like permease
MDRYVVIILMVLDCALGATGAMFFKKSSAKIELNLKIKNLLKIACNTMFIAGIFFYVLGAALLTFLLKTQNLSLVYPLTSMTYIFIVLLSVKFLGEKMNKFKWMAILLIITGNVLIAL